MKQLSPHLMTGTPQSINFYKKTK